MQEIDKTALISIAIGALSFISGVVAWGFRLEGRVNFAERRADETDRRVNVLQVKHDELDSKIVEELSRLRESTARIEGYLRAKQEKEI